MIALSWQRTYSSGDAGMLGEAARDALAVLKLAKLPGHAGDLDPGAAANEDLQKKGT